MATKNENKIILNTTKSSTQRWTYLQAEKQLVNGKNSYELADFLNGDHPQRDEVKGWLADRGIQTMEQPVAVAAQPETNTFPETDVTLQMTAPERLVAMLAHELPPGKERNQKFLESINGLPKGQRRRFRKTAFGMGLRDLASAKIAA